MKDVMADLKQTNSEKILLSWVRQSTKNYPQVNVVNFSSSWEDGLAFSALIHSHRLASLLTSIIKLSYFSWRRKVEKFFVFILKDRSCLTGMWWNRWIKLLKGWTMHSALLRGIWASNDYSTLRVWTDFIFCMFTSFLLCSIARCLNCSPLCQHCDSHHPFI